MNTSGTDSAFTGSIAQFYERWMVPLIFAPYAADLALRVAHREPARVLEIAAGTGVVTRALAARLPADVGIVATDLNQPMLDHAAVVGTSRPVEWRLADAAALPFPEHSFDVVVCQFGVMFFADRARAFSEARRALRPGGALIFNVWDRIERNEFADTVTSALQTIFPDDPPRFMARVPHGYHDTSTIARDLALGGFAKPAEFTTRAERSRAETARAPALAYCQGTPLRNEIEARGATRLAEATDVAAAAISGRFGSGAVDGEIRAHIVVVER